MGKGIYFLIISLGLITPRVTVAAGMIQATGFPTTAADATFTTRMENQRVGYEPFKDLSAYTQLNIETAEQALARQITALESQRQIDRTRMSKAEYCDKYPLDDAVCPQRPGLEQEVIAIGDNPNKRDAPHVTPQPQTPSKPTPQPEQNQRPQPNKPVQPVPVPTPISGTSDNHTRGGKCTPSARSNNFVNKILTTGKYESIDPAFEKAMVQFFRMEGECGYHPADSGGYTCYGFAQNYNPDIDVRKLTRAGAEDRTYERIYRANGIDKLPDSVRGDVLRGWFGSGYHGIQQLQKTLNLPQTKTGRVTDEMAAAAENFNGDLHNAYWDNMQQFYIGITERKPSQKVFLKGWMNGVKLMRENGCHVVPEQPLTR